VKQRTFKQPKVTHLWWCFLPALWFVMGSLRPLHMNPVEGMWHQSSLQPFLFSGATFKYKADFVYAITENQVSYSQLLIYSARNRVDPILFALMLLIMKELRPHLDSEMQLAHLKMVLQYCILWLYNEV